MTHTKTTRHTLKLALSRVRAARTSTARAGIRYGRQALVALLVRSAMAKLNAAEAALLEAQRRVGVKVRRVA
jgi:hypothetical protein